MDLSKYLRPEPILPVPVSVGCYFGACRFCSRQRLDESVRYREASGKSAAAIMEDLARKTGAKHFILAEDIVSHRFMVSLARSIAERGLGFKWFCEASFKSRLVNGLSSADCALLYRGGCRVILNGLESGSARIREEMGCPVDETEYAAALRRLISANIIPYTTLIVGYPGESATDLDETIRFMRTRHHSVVFALSRFGAVPGTPLIEELATMPNASLHRQSATDGCLEYTHPDTLDAETANNMLGSAVPDLLGSFPQFVRSIPVLMQMADKVGA
jgi:anaerobic magnesium-protoporphyrin IX monomethyl ester cyclase